MANFLSFNKNTKGYDYIVGDIHGSFSKLKSALVDIQFNPGADRLFSVGDLVDRGPESHHVIDWLKKPWFNAMQGNHEQLIIHYARNGIDNEELCIRNGALWFLALSDQEKEELAYEFEDLPIAMEIETDNGLAGLVHAEVPYQSWSKFKMALLTGSITEDELTQSAWGRDKVKSLDRTPINDVERVFVGHSMLKDSKRLGNVRYIDTGAYKDVGKFTIVKACGRL